MAYGQQEQRFAQASIIENKKAYIFFITMALLSTDLVDTPQKSFFRSQGGDTLKYIMNYCKNVMIFLPLLFALLFLQAPIAIAASITTCPGKPADLGWQSAGVVSCTLSVNGTTDGVVDSNVINKCSFDSLAAANTSQSMPATLHSGQSCSVVFTCTPVPTKTTDLTAVESSACCSTYDNTNNTAWEPTISVGFGHG